MTEIRFSGYGGQGIIVAGYIIGQAASIFEHKYATFIQDYGPEARGGTCRADVVVSDERVLYPYITAPSVLVAMSQTAYDRYHPENHRDALVIIDKDLVKPTRMRGKELLAAPARRHSVRKTPGAHPGRWPGSPPAAPPRRAGDSSARPGRGRRR